MIRGIDVSAWQKDIDWEKVKRAGIDFAIVKAGGSDAGYYTDKYFLKNIIGASQVGINVGAYYFVGKKCKSSAEGLADAMRFHEIIKVGVYGYPVYIDFEAPDKSNKQGNTDAVKAFCEYMEAMGYYVGIYASDISGFKDRLNLSQLNAFDKWVARYGSEPKYAKNWGIWQYSSSGIIDGIKGRVDVNQSKVDYPGIIKTHHLNGF